MTRFARLSSRLAEIARMFALAAFTLALANLTSSAAPAPDDKRVALVIGNGAYENAVRLDNAAFDARAVADAFRKLGFQVIDGYDLDIAEMRAKISEFSADLSNAKSAVIYYAGHGVSVDDENYLIPTDIVIKSPTDLDLNAISISLLLKEMKLDEGVNIVILDACRDNPFAAELARHKTRSIVGERGLSRIRRRSCAGHAHRLRERPQKQGARRTGRARTARSRKPSSPTSSTRACRSIRS